MKKIVIALAVGLALAGAVTAQEASFVRQTPVTKAIGERMGDRFKQIRPLLDAGTVGFGNDGMLVLRQAPEGLGEIKRVRVLVHHDNQDRQAVVAELARANNKPQWAPQVQATFAQQWVEHARPGWYYQDKAGNWVRK